MNWKDLFKRKKQDSVFEVIELMQTVNNRKLKHLHDVLKGALTSAKIEYNPPGSFITDYEEKILERFAGEKAVELKKLINSSYEYEVK